MPTEYVHPDILPPSPPVLYGIWIGGMKIGTTINPEIVVNEVLRGRRVTKESQCHD